MIITISIVLKFSGSIIKNIAGNSTKNNIDKNILNTTVAYTNTSYNYVANTTNTVAQNNTVVNETVISNSVSNIISVENTVSQNNLVQNTVTPPMDENEIRGLYVNTGIILSLGDSIQQAVITTDDVYTSFLTQFNVSRNLPGVSNYMSEDYFRTNNLGVIYIPLEDGQSFEIEKQGESGGTLYLNLILNPNYSGFDKTGGMLVLIEINKNTTTLQVSS